MISYTSLDKTTGNTLSLADKINDLVRAPLNFRSLVHSGDTKYETSDVISVSPEIYEIIGTGRIRAKFLLSPKGLIVVLHGVKGRHILTIPFQTMSIYYSREISIFSGHNCLKLPRKPGFEQERFFRKLMDLSAKYQLRKHTIQMS